MREITLKEQKNIEVDILKHIHNICQKNDIQYSLAGGTLLGAVRHKGFIPWDDDIDIVLPRPEYEKLMSILSTDSTYRLFREGDTGYFYPFAKLVDSRTVLIENRALPIEGLGVYVDIFPVDGLPSDRRMLHKHIKTASKYLYRMWNATPGEFYYYAPKMSRRILKFIVKGPLVLYYRHKGIFYWSNKLIEHLKQYPFTGAEMVGFIASIYKEKDAMPATFYSGYVPMEFEGLSVMAMAGWKQYLEALYGDYMKLPPKEKQVSHHDFFAYWKE